MCGESLMLTGDCQAWNAPSVATETVVVSPCHQMYADVSVLMLRCMPSAQDVYEVNALYSRYM